MKPEFATLFPTDDALLALYARSATDIRVVVAGMTHKQLLAAPLPGKWSTQQVIIHIADADIAFTHRIKRILAEDHPKYSKWNENDFVANLKYDEQSIDDAITAVDAVHRQMERIIKAIGVASLDRVGVHSIVGEQTARDVLQYATWHVLHHLKFVRDKRAALGLH